jgi:hypothetical protein
VDFPLSLCHLQKKKGRIFYFSCAIHKKRRAGFFIFPVPSAVKEKGSYHTLSTFFVHKYIYTKIQPKNEKIKKNLVYSRSHQHGYRKIFDGFFFFLIFNKNFYTKIIFFVKKKKKK